MIGRNSQAIIRKEITLGHLVIVQKNFSNMLVQIIN